ncbi:MAG: 1,4-alpha-glucan branching protein GlgB [Gammaproteobacteria bacterium]|nr:1,4-alpha-glucan branching protein GlgB [Gammaproteobacteria bacterium]
MRRATGQDAGGAADDLARLVAMRHHDPGQVLGRHRAGGSVVARSLVPGASAVLVEDSGKPMCRIGGSDVFEWRGAEQDLPERFRIRWVDRSGRSHTQYEPYCFPPLLNESDLESFNAGRHQHAYRFLGARVFAVDGIAGVLFATWAPNAERVSIIGDFNQWDGRRHPMRVRGSSGVWELFIPGVAADALYKFEIRARTGGGLLTKFDPYARRYEYRPATASIVTRDVDFQWNDRQWLDARAGLDWEHAPMSIYELHAGSWQRGADGSFLNFRELARRLVPYLLELGFTHVELLPITEHPLDASWGYQTTGFYAPSSRHGDASDFRYFVDYCHCHGLGVILDWVAGHFPKDLHALYRFDGTALYEHEDPRRGEHRDWGTLAFNYSRHEVRSFLISNAFYWIEEYHVDGLRVDAVAAMLYLDYSRRDGEWLPNEHGGNENLEAIAFVRDLNEQVLTRFPGVKMIAEESTAWPLVTRPAWVGGLGFTMKWNMGWMHDTLNYLRKDPIFRQFHHDHLTFGLLYAFHENFVLPFSHDEVVHGKGSLLSKMPGDDWQRFATLRLLYTYQFTYPGKKLLFMGNELAQWREWNHEAALDWNLLDEPWHKAMHRLVADLNRLYVQRPELHALEFEQAGFEWLDCHDALPSVLCYLRRHRDRFVVVVLNFTPVPRAGYRVGVPVPGFYRELLNSDSRHYCGSDLGNGGGVESTALAWMGREYSLSLTLPPLAGLILESPTG